MKLVDRGDEVVLDTSELLPLNPAYEKLPAFAQLFRLDGFDESVRIQKFFCDGHRIELVNFHFVEKYAGCDQKLETINAEQNGGNYFGFRQQPVNGAYVVQVNIDKQNLNSLPLHSSNFTVTHP